jgi:hypothetical protein
VSVPLAEADRFVGGNDAVLVVDLGRCAECIENRQNDELLSTGALKLAR